jgi:hypothetical protein
MLLIRVYKFSYYRLYIFFKETGAIKTISGAAASFFSLVLSLWIGIFSVLTFEKINFLLIMVLCLLLVFANMAYFTDERTVLIGKEYFKISMFYRRIISFILFLLVILLPITFFLIIP